MSVSHLKQWFFKNEKPTDIKTSLEHDFRWFFFPPCHNNKLLLPDVSIGPLPERSCTKQYKHQLLDPIVFQ